MASTLTKRIRSGLLLAFLGLGLIAIVVTGFGTDGTGGLGPAGGASAQTIAEVGDKDLTDAEVSQLIDGRYRQIARSQPNLDRAQFIDEGFTPLLERIILDNALVQFGRDLGLVVPPRMVDRIIVGIPAFQNVAGRFDETAYRNALQQQNLTERQLREDIGNGEIMRMVLAPVASNPRVPRAVATEYANLLLEQRRGGLGAVPVQLLTGNINPSDQEVANFYRANQRRFAYPERRVLRFALMGREQLGAAVTATDQEMAAYYQQNQAQYGPGETRNIQLFTTQDQAAAQRLAQQVRGGTSFIDAARAAGFAPEDVNLPDQSREQFTARSNAELANQVFAAQQGALVGPVRTQIGFQVARVEAVNRTPARPLAAVQPEIRAAVEQRKLAEQLNALAERIQERLDDGASFEEIAQAERLTVQTTPPMTQTGAAPGTSFQFPPNLAPLLQATFDMSPGDDPLLEVLQPDLVSLASVTPPQAPPLEQIRDQVRAAMIQQTGLQRARQIADGIVNRINGGMAPAQAYAQAGVRLPPTQNVDLRRLQIGQPGQDVPPPLRMLFSIPEGRARFIPAPNNGGYIIVHHLQRSPGNAAADPRGAQLVATTQAGFAESAAAELQEQFSRAVAATVSVERNEERIQALRQRLRAGQ
jgi:peptidyl-prolyl cis-trans isomerase D